MQLAFGAGALWGNRSDVTGQGQTVAGGERGERQLVDLGGRVEDARGGDRHARLVERAEDRAGALDRVVALAAEDHVIARPAGDVVVAVMCGWRRAGFVEVLDVHVRPYRDVPRFGAENASDTAGDVDRIGRRRVGIDLRPGQRLEARIVRRHDPDQGDVVAEDQVVAGAAADPVIAGAADQDVVAAADRVRAARLRIGLDDVVDGRAADCDAFKGGTAGTVCRDSRFTGNRIDIRDRIDRHRMDIAAAERVHRHPAVVADNEVVALPAPNVIVARAADDVVAGAATAAVLPAGAAAVNRICPEIVEAHAFDVGHIAGRQDALRCGRLIDLAVIADDDVVAAAAIDRVVAGGERVGVGRRRGIYVDLQQHLQVGCDGGAQANRHRHMVGDDIRLQDPFILAYRRLVDRVQVEAVAAQDVVVARAAVDRVAAAAAGDPVAAGATINRVVAGTAVQDDRVGVVAGVEGVVAGIVEDARLAGERRRRRIVERAVLRRRADQHQRRILAAAAVGDQRIAAAAALDDRDRIADIGAERAGRLHRRRIDGEGVVARPQHHVDDLHVAIGDAAGVGYIVRVQYRAEVQNQRRRGRRPDSRPGHVFAGDVAEFQRVDRAGRDAAQRLVERDRVRAARYTGRYRSAAEVRQGPKQGLQLRRGGRAADAGDRAAAARKLAGEAQAVGGGEVGVEGQRLDLTGRPENPRRRDRDGRLLVLLQQAVHVCARQVVERRQRARVGFAAAGVEHIEDIGLRRCTDGIQTVRIDHRPERNIGLGRQHDRRPQ